MRIYQGGKHPVRCGPCFDEGRDRLARGIARIFDSRALGYIGYPMCYDCALMLTGGELYSENGRCRRLPFAYSVRGAHERRQVLRQRLWLTPATVERYRPHYHQEGTDDR